MSDPFRLTILKTLTTELSAISGLTVYRGRTLFGESDTPPVLSILDDPTFVEGLETPPMATSSIMWHLVLQGFVVDDFDHPTDPAHVLMFEVKKKLAELRVARPILGITGKSKVEDLRIGGGVVRPPKTGEYDHAFFWLPVSLKLIENLS